MPGRGATYLASVARLARTFGVGQLLLDHAGKVVVWMTRQRARRGEILNALDLGDGQQVIVGLPLQTGHDGRRWVADITERGTERTGIFRRMKDLDARRRPRRASGGLLACAVYRLSEPPGACGMLSASQDKLQQRTQLATQRSAALELGVFCAMFPKAKWARKKRSTVLILTTPARATPLPT